MAHTHMAGEDSGVRDFPLTVVSFVWVTVQINGW